MIFHRGRVSPDHQLDCYYRPLCPACCESSNSTRDEAFGFPSIELDRNAPKFVMPHATLAFNRVVANVA